MDSRKTLKRNDTFLALLQDLLNTGEKASLLIDDNGMERAEGIVKVIRLDNEVPFVQLEGSTKIILASIVAVNGIFHPDYSEC